MTASSSRPQTLRRTLFAAALLAGAWFAVPWLLSPLVAAGLRATTRARGLQAHWRSLAFHWPLTVDVRGLTLTRAGGGPPAVTVERLQAALGPRDLSLRPHVTLLVLERGHLVLPTGAMDGDSSSAVREEPVAGHGPTAPRVRAAAQQLANALMLPARRLPELRLTDLDVQRGDSLFAHLTALSLVHPASGVQLTATGHVAGVRPIPFDAMLQWSRDDRLTGRMTFRFAGDTQDRGRPLVLVVDGRLSQDRRAGVLRIAEGSLVRIGSTAMRVAGEVHRQGPRFRMALELDGLTARAVQKSLPAPILGPLADLSVHGSWDWRTSLSLDVAAPESTRFTADVIPHGLVLGEAGARMRLARLAEPFLAEIHVPHGIVYRDLSSANPNFRPLERISPLLRYALLTNEDGSFYHHRGFNTEAIQLAMADNLRAGAFRRGAGTVTMQLVRNLFLGHQRTLSRKGQEVVLAWVIEHLTGLSKDRLLEIYLNIIEWGPALHGANEAARFYFAKDAADVTLDEALFLAVIVPSPSRWRTRVDATGALRPWVRSQMAYIAGKMVARGWLAPEQVPDAAALHVELRGPAGASFSPSDMNVVPEPNRGE
jgi:hypothetical protein